MKFHVKIRDEATEPDRKSVEEAARKLGAASVRCLFPDAAEPSLNTLYTLDVPDTDAEKLVQSLQSLPFVEFVERHAKRKLKG